MKSRDKAAGRVGEMALPFALQDDKGCVVRLEDCLGNWLLLVFHRHLA